MTTEETLVLVRAGETYMTTPSSGVSPPVATSAARGGVVAADEFALYGMMKEAWGEPLASGLIGRICP